MVFTCLGVSASGQHDYLNTQNKILPYHEPPSQDKGRALQQVMGQALGRPGKVCWEFHSKSQSYILKSKQDWRVETLETSTCSPGEVYSAEVSQGKRGRGRQEGSSLGGFRLRRAAARKQATEAASLESGAGAGASAAFLPLGAEHPRI